MDGFEDASAMLGPGIYILRKRGRVVYVGKARSVLVMIAKHRELANERMPEWFPVKGMIFDEVLWKTSHPDRIDAEIFRLKDKYNLGQNTLSEVA